MTATIHQFPTPPKACKDAELAIAYSVIDLLQTAESLFNAGVREESRELLDHCIFLAKFASSLVDVRVNRV